MKTEVFCTLEIEGTHRWKNCPFDEVSYLRDKHRHLFKIKANKIVNHDDRDVEFIMLKHDIKQYFSEVFLNDTTKIHDFGDYSCEWIAHNLIQRFKLSQCEVSEDGENGAIVTAHSPADYAEECKVCGIPKQEGCKVC